MKTHLDMDKIATGLGAQRQGKVRASGGYFGAMQLRADVEARFRVPSGGGRATDPLWTERRLVPLGVGPALLRKHGAVSAECAEAMARGARTAAGAHLGVSNTGVAGPGGGSKEKPVGLVHIAVSGPGSRMRSKRLDIFGPREAVRSRAVTAVLALLKDTLDGPVEVS